MVSQGDVIFLGLFAVGTIAVVALKTSFDQRRRSSSKVVLPSILRAGPRHKLSRNASLALYDRMDYPGKAGAPWSADDDDHAWRVGVVHAYAQNPFNPPRQPEYRAVYLDGYRSTSEDEGIPNTFPES